MANEYPRHRIFSLMQIMAGTLTLAGVVGGIVLAVSLSTETTPPPPVPVAGVQLPILPTITPTPLPPTVTPTPTPTSTPAPTATPVVGDLNKVVKAQATSISILRNDLYDMRRRAEALESSFEAVSKIPEDIGTTVGQISVQVTAIAGLIVDDPLEVLKLQRLRDDLDRLGAEKSQEIARLSADVERAESTNRNFLFLILGLMGSVLLTIVANFFQSRRTRPSEAQSTERSADSNST